MASVNDAECFLDALYGEEFEGTIEIRPLPVGAAERRWFHSSREAASYAVRIAGQCDCYSGVGLREHGMGTKDGVLSPPYGSIWTSRPIGIRVKCVRP